MKKILTIILLNGFVSCNSYSSKSTALHSYSLFRYLKIPQRYAYNNHRLFFKHEWFLLKTVQEFSNDTIRTVSINNPEDLIFYTKKELLSDTLLFNGMAFSKEKTLIVDGKYVTNNGVKIYITEIRGDSIFCLNNDTLLLIKTTQ